MRARGSSWRTTGPWERTAVPAWPRAVSTGMRATRCASAPTRPRKRSSARIAIWPASTTPTGSKPIPNASARSPTRTSCSSPSWLRSSTNASRCPRSRRMPPPRPMSIRCCMPKHSTWSRKGAGIGIRLTGKRRAVSTKTTRSAARRSSALSPSRSSSHSSARSR